jgi:hypothetical protein
VLDTTYLMKAQLLAELGERAAIALCDAAIASYERRIEEQGRRDLPAGRRVGEGR